MWLWSGTPRPESMLLVDLSLCFFLLSCGENSRLNNYVVTHMMFFYRVDFILELSKKGYTYLSHETLQIPFSTTSVFDVYLITCNNTTQEQVQTRTHTHTYKYVQLAPTCVLSRETHLDSMEPRVRLGIMWFRSFATKTCKQRSKLHLSVSL